jgi:hypothetical protein
MSIIQSDIVPASSNGVRVRDASGKEVPVPPHWAHVPTHRTQSELLAERAKPHEDKRCDAKLDVDQDKLRNAHDWHNWDVFHAEQVKNQKNMSRSRLIEQRRLERIRELHESKMEWDRAHPRFADDSAMWKHKPKKPRARANTEDSTDIYNRRRQARIAGGLAADPVDINPRQNLFARGEVKSRSEMIAKRRERLVQAHNDTRNNTAKYFKPKSQREAEKIDAQLKFLLSCKSKLTRQELAARRRAEREATAQEFLTKQDGLDSLASMKPTADTVDLFGNKPPITSLLNYGRDQYSDDDASYSDGQDDNDNNNNNADYSDDSYSDDDCSDDSERFVRDKHKYHLNETLSQPRTLLQNRRNRQKITDTIDRTAAPGPEHYERAARENRFKDRKWTTGTFLFKGFDVFKKSARNSSSRTSWITSGANVIADWERVPLDYDLLGIENNRVSQQMKKKRRKPLTNPGRITHEQAVAILTKNAST